MRSYKEEITKICKYAIQHANAKGLDYAKDFIDPNNWDIVQFHCKGKMQYIIWNKVFRGSNDGFVRASTTSFNFPKFIYNNFNQYDKFIGNTPEEAFEKWVDDLFNGEESLSSVRLHIEIAGIS